jgi:hypothetical protein
MLFLKQIHASMLIDILKHSTDQIFALNPNYHAFQKIQQLTVQETFVARDAHAHAHHVIFAHCRISFLPKRMRSRHIFLRGMHTRIFSRDLPAVGGSFVGDGSEVGACLICVL